MSYSAEGAYIWGFPADVDMSNEGVYQYAPVSIQTSTTGVGVDQGNTALVPWASGMTCVGILMNAPRPGQGGTYAHRGVLRARCVGAWSKGQNLTAAVGGFQPAGSSDPVFGFALNDAVVGDIGVLQR